MAARGPKVGPAPTPLPGIIPPMVVQPGVEKLDSPVKLTDDTEFPIASFTMAKMDKRKRRMPQCIAHRGYKAKFPENSILAFERAIEAGADALETDMHLTKDDVVVLSHDATLRRCFGRKDKIIDKNWDELRDLKTIAAPHVPMARLGELLEFLSRPGLEEIWVCLDIKLDNNADDVMRLIGSTIADSKPSPGKPWSERIVLGLWAAKYLPLAERYLPGYSVIHIGFKISYAQHFFTVPNVGFSMLLPILMAPGGRGFIEDCKKKHHRQVMAWTVNARDRMEWCIRRRLDGVITDDPAVFLDVCEKFDEYSKEPTIPVGFRSLLEIARVYFFIQALFWLFRRRLNSKTSPTLIEKVPKRT